MALVEIARFSDLREGQIAASRLRATGLMPILWDEYRGSIDFFLWQALGGFRLCVIEDEAEEARALITLCRTSDPAVLDWIRHPEAVSSAPAALFWAVTDPQSGGYAWANLKRRFSLTSLIVMLLSLAKLGTLIVFSMLGGHANGG